MRLQSLRGAAGCVALVALLALPAGAHSDATAVISGDASGPGKAMSDRL